MAALNERGSHISSFRSLYSAELKTNLHINTLNERGSLYLNLDQTIVQSTIKNLGMRMVALNERGSLISSVRSLCGAQLKTKTANGSTQ